MFDVRYGSKKSSRVKTELKIDFKTALDDNAVIQSRDQLQHVVTHIKKSCKTIKRDFLINVFVCQKKSSEWMQQNDAFVMLVFLH